MRTILWLPFSSALTLLLASCANNGGSSPDGTGPFDAQGNYHEEWANDPSKWSKPGKHTQPQPNEDLLPLVAKNEQPPPNANPLAPQGANPPQPMSHKANSTPPESAHHIASSATKGSSNKATGTKGKSTRNPRLAQSSTKGKTQPKSKSSSSSSTRHIVKKGDSLYTLSKRYGTSISAIQKANGLSGTVIVDGRSLVIPKKR